MGGKSRGTHSPIWCRDCHHESTGTRGFTLNGDLSQRGVTGFRCSGWGDVYVLVKVLVSPGGDIVRSFVIVTTIVYQLKQHPVVVGEIPVGGRGSVVSNEVGLGTETLAGGPSWVNESSHTAASFPDAIQRLMRSTGIVCRISPANQSSSLKQPKKDVDTPNWRVQGDHDYIIYTYIYLQTCAERNHIFFFLSPTSVYLALCARVM